MRYLPLVLSLLFACDGDKNAPSDDTAPDTIDIDGDGYIAGEDDCDDGDPTVHVSADELCDGIDNDCDDVIDEDAGTAFYTDTDGDGYGDDGTATMACEAPPGMIETGGDCDDADSAYHPGAEESDCSDPNDYNCDGSVGYTDGDGDGFAACADCDDGAPDVNDDAAEICDGVDNDCNSLVDDGVATMWYLDADGDGYGDASVTADGCDAPTGYVADGTDCDDADGAIHPGADEADCDDPTDYNCDGSVGYTDGDGDGFAACDDCDDASATVNAGQVETCDGVDDNCDGTVDEDTAIDAVNWYADADADGYGDASVFATACAAPSGYVADQTDCNDTDAAYNPGAAEADCADPNDYNCDGSVGYSDADGDGYAACQDCDDARADVSPVGVESCNGLDDNCDSIVDEDAAIDALVWYADTDGDGYGDASLSTTACNQPSSYVADATDCFDGDAAYNPGAVEADCTDPNDYNCDGSVGYADADGDGFAACADCDDTSAAINTDGVEICDGVDDDCDGAVDEDGATGGSLWYLDADADGYGDASSYVAACDAPAGYVADATDCDDASAAYNPGATEACTDPNDYNCDGSVGYADADGDGVAACEDCDDSRADINPFGTEICDGVDDNCDGVVDEATAIDATTWYADVDADGYGDAGTSAVSCDAPTGYVSDATDCDDADTTYNPGATEACDDPNDYNCDGSTGYADADGDGFAACEDCDDDDAAINTDGVESCNGVDDNCDGVVDESGASGETLWYLDADSDGYGDASVSVTACDAPSGYVADATDCDDADAAYNPGAAEACTDPNDYNCDGSVGYADDDGDGFAACEDCDDSRADINADAAETCDGVDDDCDGAVDEASAIDVVVWYADADGDGYGDAATTTTACDAPAGYVADAADCDDTSALYNPGATEACTDPNDYNCDGSTGYVDADGDGFAACADCDDADASVNTDATEACDGVDNDCDGATDETGATGEGSWYADADADGYGDASEAVTACDAPAGYVADATDCDDTDAAYNPGATEVCTDPNDYNCDGSTGYADDDGDTFAACEDCDDSRADVNPDATEVCDGVDDDCDGNVDEASAADVETWYADADADGYGDLSVSTVSCDAPAGYGADASDCDDGNASAYPGAAETCDGADNDCDGAVDESGGTASWYADADGDGYGDEAMSATGCDAPVGYVADATDCDDAAADVNPGETEVCSDGLDNDCSGDPTECELSGTNNITAAPGHTWQGAASNDFAGSSVAMGDFDGDGTDDVFVGSYGWDVSSANLNDGRVYGYYGPIGSGTTTVGTSADVYVSGISANDVFGSAMAKIEDFDADGDDELLVGSYLRGSIDAGAAYLFRGGSMSSGTAASAYGSFASTATSDWGGWAVADAGDFDGDGTHDILVGAYKRDNGATSDAGLASIFYSTNTSGSRGIPTNYDVALSGTTATGYLGYALDGVGDVDGDGVDDIVVGAYGEASFKGRAYLLLGGASGALTTSDADAVVTGTNTSDRLGLAVAGLGDTDGDGLADWAVSADYANDASTDSGSVYVFYGDLSGSVAASAADVRFTGGAASDYAGRTVKGAGDVNDDGMADLLIGATAQDGGASGGGAAYLFYGPLASGSVTTADAIWQGTTTNWAVGYALAGGGDPNGDGYDDFFITSASYESSSATPDIGAAWLYFGAGE